MKLTKKKFISGEIKVPGDKSLSHRAFLFSALAKGKSQVFEPLLGADVLSTIDCLTKLGVKFTKTENGHQVESPGMESFTAPGSDLDCGNSGTTMRLLMGILAGQSFPSTLIGDESLSKRPMARISKPLELMGAKFELKDDNYVPVKICPSKLKAIDYKLTLASAQLKSALLLAGLQAEGVTRLTGKLNSRDHTERLLPYYDVETKVSESEILIEGGQLLTARDFTVPADPSSAAFWAAATLMLENSEIKMSGVLLNPTRIGFFKVLERMGAKVEYSVSSTEPEVIGDIKVSSSKLKGVEIGGAEIPSLIDEIPMLAILAAKAEGETRVTGAKELRVKESDRLAAVEKNLKAIGVEIEMFEDGFSIHGPQEFHGAVIETYHDHRIAMGFSIAALVAEGETEILDSSIVDVSYPGFYKTLEEVTSE